MEAVRFWRVAYPCFFKKIFSLIFVMALAVPATANAVGMTRAQKYPQVITPSTVESLIMEHVDELMAEAHETRRYTVDVVHIPKNIRAPEGELSYSVTTPNGLRYSSNTAVYVEIFVDGVSFRKVSCKASVHIYDMVCVAARPIQPNTPITREDVRLEEQDIGSRGKNYFLTIDEVIGRVVSRRMNIGQPMMQAMLKWPELIEPGAPITIITDMKGVKIKTEGTALEAGRLHERIRVRNNNSRKVIRARVIDANTVEVEN